MPAVSALAAARPQRPAWSLALLALAGLITALDFTIVYVALPDIADDVGFTPHSLQWVVSSYAVAYGGLLLLGGRLADLLGRRRMFVAGMALYGFGSLLGGLASAPGPLIAARAVQGAGGAVLFPATLSLVGTMFAEGPQRTRAMTVWAVSGAAGLSLGALSGGVLTGAFGWSAVFFVNVPLVVIGGAAAFRLLPTDGARRGERGSGGGFDVPGALTGTAGLTLLVCTLAQGPVWGWASARVVGAALVGTLLLGVFAAVETRAAHPLLPLRLFRNRNVTASAAVILVFGATAQSVPYFLTMFFQAEMGFSALRTGIAFLGPTLALTCGNVLGERLLPWLGLRGTLASGLAVTAVGSALFAWAMTDSATYPKLLAGIVAYGLGGGVSFSTMWMAAGTGVVAHEQGVASGLASTALQFGASAGLALLVPLDGVRTAMAVVAVGTMAGVVAAFALPGRSKPQVGAAENVPEPLSVRRRRA
ncbi:MFS transporter [Yinghuangia aomiensis]|uniref:MFS transporter n=1 Tax=Yinghuangia aomiensis TaxID=676205 RepID=A0ABP9HWZ4_9ACTN